MSTAEPELGLGTVLRVEGRGVQVLFAKAGVLRQYAQHSAPLLRAAFRQGQKVLGQGRSLLVERVAEEDGMLVYYGGNDRLAEGELDDEQSISHADERLLSGRVDPVDHFELRHAALRQRAEARGRQSWGLNSARIDLLDHQLQVVARATAQRSPRVLLADEVGLGKTIEAGLIISRQLAAGLARRVLVVVPENLVHQWFVELLRRFNLAFSIFDAARMQAGVDHPGNPFEEEQRVLVSQTFLLASEKTGAEVLQGDWDMLVVDEAHHLQWTPEASGPGYQLVEQLAANTPSVILLTATPEQSGRRGHFARLRLLDPARYASLDAYLAESESWVALSGVADKLTQGLSLSHAECESLFTQYPADEPLRELILRHADSPQASSELLSALIDRHGTGRVMFRNRRDLIGGFPAREAHLEYLPASAAGEARRHALRDEFEADIGEGAEGVQYDYADDPRLAWLIGLLAEYPQDKFLLICRSQAKVLALDEALAGGDIRVSRFHEGLGLVQRDRNAAWFAEPDGAQLLLSSEIGSEGRNFQFAQRLVLWDLPLDPDLLEQRIGRLDRIGRKDEAIHIHSAVVEATAQQALSRWYDEGMDAFRSSPADGRSLLNHFAEDVARVARLLADDAADAEKELNELLAETATVHAELARTVHEGRDRLLELAASSGRDAEPLTQALEAGDRDDSGHEFMQRLLEHFGVQIDELGGGALRLDPEFLATDALAGFSSGPFSVTFDRQVALRRDDLPLLRFDHPLMLGALDLLLGSEQGNASFMCDTALSGKQVLLQAVFVLECVADASLDVQRFLPAQPITTTLDSRLRAQPHYAVSAQALARAAQQPIDVPRYRRFLLQLVPPMLASAEETAQAEAERIAQHALQQAERQLGAERQRLLALREVNPAVSHADVERVENELQALRKALPSARLRLDSLRMVVSPQFLDLR